MTFKEYLESKKIDTKLFYEGEAKLFAEWKAIYTEVSPKSFTQQKLFLINKIRRKYQLKDPISGQESEVKKAPMKVKIGGKSLGVKIGKK